MKTRVSTVYTASMTVQDTSLLLKSLFMMFFCIECKRRYSVKLWKEFNDCLNCLPLVATVDKKIFCVHGGLSPELTSLDQINQIPRPSAVPDQGMLCDFLWSDPDGDIRGWGENDRGASYVFGANVISEVCWEL